MYIYKIWSDKCQECYIGSTIQSLNRRFTNHKSDYLNIKNKNFSYYKLFDKYGMENFCIELLEELDDINQLKIREQYWIDNTKNTVNNRNAFGHKDYSNQQKEYYENNKEYKIEYQKEYREKNKEKIYKRLSEKIQCECGSFISRSNLTRHKKENCKLTIR